MNRIVELRRALATAVSDSRAILATAREDDDRALTDDETTAFEALSAKIDGLRASIDREQSLADAERVMQVADDADITGGEPAADETGNPFPSFGHQLQAIIAAGMPGGSTFAGLRTGHIDPRLLMVNEIAGVNAAVPSGGAAGVGGDGGFLIGTDYSQTIYQRAYELGALLSRCDRYPIGQGSDSLSVPYLDEKSRKTGSRWGGVRVYRRAEADTVNASRPKIEEMETRLEDLMGIAYATNRLLQDATAMGALYQQTFASEFAFVTDDEIFSGSGAGQCLGVMKSAAKVTVAKESGQGAATVVSENIAKMWARMWARSRMGAVWFINQEVEEQLPLLLVGDRPVYVPPGGFSGAPYGTMYGRPVIPIEHAEALGTEGDISLWDLSEYQIIDKGGVQGATSMHVRFVYDEMAFRWIMRINGQPKWKTSLEPYKGGSGKKLSPFITLATRA